MPETVAVSVYNLAAPRRYNPRHMLSGLSNRLRSRSAPAFYGWWFAAAGATLNALSSGFYGRAFAVYFLPLARDLGLSHTATSLVYGFSQLEGAIQGPITGYCIDRWGPRIMMVLGAILAGTGFLLLPFTSNYVLFLLVYAGVISLGIHAGFSHGVAAIVNRWFVRRRGMAFGLVSVGFALGGGLITPVVAVVVLNLGWRVAALISGVVLLGVGLPLSAMMRGAPEEIGQFPDGVKPAGRSESATRRQFVPVEGVDYTAREAFKTRSYWLLAVGICLRIAAHTGVFVHIVPLMVWKGFGEATGGVMVAAISFSAVATRLLMGWWGDRWSKRNLAAIAMLVGASSLVFLVFSPGHLFLMVLFAVAFSVTDGAAGLTWALIGDFFGRRAFATLRGGVNLLAGLGAFVTPIVAGRVFDVTHSYYWALLPFAAIYVVAAFIFFILRSPKRDAQSAP